MAKFTELFSGTVRTTKDAVRHGPLKVRRVMATPPDTFGRNGDIIIVDDTAESTERLAENRVPTDIQLCQKIPITVSAGTFTITTGAGVFVITIASLDDVVEQVNRARIPGVEASIIDRANIFITCPSIVTFADGTSDFPSVTGIAGPNSGELTIATGTWECQVFPASVEVLDEGISLGQFNAINFTGAGVVASDSGGGEAAITITGGGGGGSDAYVTITGDTGSSTASGVDTLDVIGVTGGIITTTAADGAPDSLTLETVNVMEWSAINGQQVLTFEDPTRSDKRLSVTDHPIMFANNALDDDEWMDIGDASNTDVGYVADLDGTIVMATGQCEDANGNSKEIHVFVNGTDEGSVGTLSGGDNVQFVTTTLDIDFDQGDKIRLQAQNGSGGDIDDTVVKLTLKWRGT